ncbi:hypothetical protein KSP40_PGU015186 [Platanthera guangdongensis]|uniref:Uncharacterized protein n=1 Tax=Platanthera guangdongensis TaxID=2320717 RepID=A0ABR2M9U7_9ASPA
MREVNIVCRSFPDLEDVCRRPSGRYYSSPPNTIVPFAIAMEYGLLISRGDSHWSWTRGPTWAQLGLTVGGGKVTLGCILVCAVNPIYLTNIYLFLQREIQNKSQRWAFTKARKKKKLYEREILHHQIKESSVNLLNAEEHRFTVDPSSMSDVLGLLATSDNQMGLLITEPLLTTAGNRCYRAALTL